MTVNKAVYLDIYLKSQTNKFNRFPNIIIQSCLSNDELNIPGIETLTPSKEYNYMSSMLPLHAFCHLNIDESYF